MTTVDDQTTRDTAADPFVGEWNAWHGERVDAALAPYGIAAVTATHWLSETATAFPGLPGEWSVDGETVTGANVGDTGPITLAAGESRRLDELEVRVLEREGSVAVRVVDPSATSRASLADIETFPVDPDWVLAGRFVPADARSTITVRHVDGASTVDPLAGHVEVELGGVAYALAAFPLADGRLQVSFGDRTNGPDTSRFRFLTLPRPDADGRVPIDLNRAYLPPSAFTAHYLCPLPPVGNEVDVAVRAGERSLVVR